MFWFLLAAAEMGCGLNKLEKHDDKRPGNIYSTLKRPQVETKIDVSYEYRFLEFTTLSAGEYGWPKLLVARELRPSPEAEVPSHPSPPPHPRAGLVAEQGGVGVAVGNWKRWAFEKVLLAEIQIFMWNFSLFKRSQRI